MELQKTDLQLASSFLPLRRADSHKGSYGTLLSVCGSADMTGAAILAARAAYKSGCGLVLAALPEEARLPLQIAVPEAVLRPYRTDAPALSLSRATAVLIGPGLGLSPCAHQLLGFLLETLPADFPLVIDADALTLLAEEQAFREKLRGRTQTVLLPHPGEAGRLLGLHPDEIHRLGTEAAARIAKLYHAVCLLKLVPGVTLSPEGAGFINTSGNHGMATAGSGDVLAGIIGGLMAQGVPALQAACCGAFYHGLAGDCAAASLGRAGLMASDIASFLRMDRPDF